MMEKHLAARIKRRLSFVWRGKRLSVKVQKAILKELNRDLILPQLNLRKNVAIQIQVCPDEYVKGEATLELQIGPRDWSFDLKTGECFGAGTCLV